MDGKTRGDLGWQRVCCKCGKPVVNTFEGASYCCHADTLYGWQYRQAQIAAAKVTTAQAAQGVSNG